VTKGKTKWWVFICLKFKKIHNCVDAVKHFYEIYLNIFFKNIITFFDKLFIGGNYEHYSSK